MKLTILGNCATQTLDHETTSFLLTKANKHILIDCGPAVVRQLIKCSIQPEDVSAIVLTHSHGDHVAGYPYFLFMMNIGKAKSEKKDIKKIPIIALSTVMNSITQTVDFQYPVEHLNERLIEKHIVYDNNINTINIESFAITPFITEHVIPSIGLTIKSGDSVITFSGDTKYTPSVEKNALGSSTLVHEAFCTEQFANLAHSTGHSTALEAATAAKKAGVSKLILSHPLDFMWNNPSSLIKEAASVFNGEIILPYELDVLNV